MVSKKRKKSNSSNEEKVKSVNDLKEIEEICLHSSNVKDSQVKQNVVNSTCSNLKVSSRVIRDDPKLQDALVSFFKEESN